MTLFGSDPTPYIALLLVGVLPSEIWRWMALVVGRGLDETSEILVWVRAVATATLAAVVAKLAFFPGGALADLPTGWRVAAFVIGLTAYAAGRKSVLLGVLSAEAVIVGASLWLGIR
ncbi:AzlD domain-containing protein [Phreatobacter sp.]|uniref:AzlD domain-containing protein n=1 Tax=Phreatobacter sp. TaxID=1966341 RepID=UPI0022CD194E|nr:AzlD domain-containing protein [Phreatobacter sp.]MCZ8314779.1 AzlD domain-containing protein [Phreatobacter sp.]